MFVLVSLELFANVLEFKGPLFLEHVVFLETGTHMSLVLLVVLGDLRFAFLEHFDFEATLSWPLLSQILIKLLNRLILQILDLSLHLMSIVDLFSHKPGHGLHQR